MNDAYPEGFSSWPLEQRNAYFAEEARRYEERKCAERRPTPVPLELQSREPRQYPIAALGDVLAGAAQSIAAKCQCASALAAQSVLAVASLAAQRLADVRMPYGQTRPLSLYLFTLAASGERKSTADNEALIPVRMHEKNLRHDYQPAHEAWRISHAAWTAEQKKIEADRKHDRQSREAALSALGPAPLEPARPLFTAPEPTVEALAKHWGTLPGSIGLFTPEGGQLTNGYGFGPEHRLKTASCFSALWDGGGLRRFRAGDGVTDLPGRRLAMHVMIQPGAAAAFLADPILRDQGILSRLLLASPASLAGNRKWQEPSESLNAPIRRYAAAILTAFECPALAANAAGNELMPRALALSSDAKAAWVALHDHIEAAMAPDGALENLRDVGGKAAENAARIAGVLAIVENPEAAIVDGEAMTSGCELAAWYVDEALRLYDAYRQSPGLRNAIRLLDWLQAKGKHEVSLREIMQFGPSPVRQKAEAEAALAKLEEHFHVARQGDGRGARWTLTAEAAQ
jgi:Protein of unknown function (DUF3987)